MCGICKECKYPTWQGKSKYPEDSHGVPYCNMFGPLSDRSREILVKKIVAYDKVIPGAELPKKEY
jgi:hypothetical protein